MVGRRHRTAGAARLINRRGKGVMSMTLDVWMTAVQTVMIIVQTAVIVWSLRRP